MAWTGDRAAAAELTRQVFTGAMAWLPVTAGGGGEAGAWLLAMARDAVAQRRGSDRTAGDAGGGSGTAAAQAPPGDVVAAVARLGDPEREVVVLRLLLGHSLDHTAHLSGYGHRAALELQLAACLAVWRLAGGAGPGPAPATGVASAEELERRLERREADLTGGDPVLAGALAAAGSLRRAGPGHLAGPDDALVARLRHELVAGAAVDRDAHPPPDGGGGGLLRRPWVATAVATFGIVMVLGLQAFGGPGSGCDGRPCPAATSVAAAATVGSSLGTPLTTVVEPTTTSSTVAQTTRRPAPRTSAASSPATTGRVTTAAPTTRASRPTTTRAPTTTAPTTTVATTTTTSAPAPT